VVSGKRIRRLVYLGQLRDPAPLAEVPIWTHCLVSTHIHLFAIPVEGIELVQVTERIPGRCVQRVDAPRRLRPPLAEPFYILRTGTT